MDFTSRSAAITVHTELRGFYAMTYLRGIAVHVVITVRREGYEQLLFDYWYGTKPKSELDLLSTTTPLFSFIQLAFLLRGCIYLVVRH